MASGSVCGYWAMLGLNEALYFDCQTNQ